MKKKNKSIKAWAIVKNGKIVSNVYGIFDKKYLAEKYKEYPEIVVPIIIKFKI